MNSSIATIPASFVDWTFNNIPDLGILLFIAWMIWKYMSWLNSKFLAIDTRFSQIDVNFGEIRHNFQKIDVRFENMDKRLDRMEHKLDQHDDEIKQCFINIAEIKFKFESIRT